MKIFAKQGTELEKQLKTFYEQMENEKNEVRNMVEEFTGVKPVNFGYYWYFGITCVWSEDSWQFPDTEKPQNVVSYDKNGKTYFKPNKRLKKSKEFIKTWKDKFKGIDGKVLSNYGIPVDDESMGKYYNWIPWYEDNKYGIISSSSMIDSMPKIEDKQYEIEV